MRQSVSYRPIPIITTYPVNNQLTQNYNLQTYQGMPPTFKQGFPGNVIGSLPFIPIHVNVPDIIGAIIKGLQSIFGPVPIIQQNNQMQNTPQDIMMAQQNQGSMLPIGMIDKNTIGQPTMPFTMPIPIIIVLPSKQDSNDEFVQEA